MAKISAKSHVEVSVVDKQSTIATRGGKIIREYQTERKDRKLI